MATTSEVIPPMQVMFFCLFYLTTNASYRILRSYLFITASHTITTISIFLSFYT
ncbi:MAG: hypothetical protein J3R72DRAFT_448916 [Linnemannia gamsii]|nr:MAG: hypothetical protein J3R72DRAFT_448916 [Linnemannia gamsii]